MAWLPDEITSADFDTTKELVDKYGSGFGIMDFLNLCGSVNMLKRRVEYILSQKDLAKVRIDKYPITMISVHYDRIYASFNRNLKIGAQVIFHQEYFIGEERDFGYEFYVEQIDDGIHILVSCDGEVKLKSNIPKGLNVFCIERKITNTEIDLKETMTRSATMSTATSCTVFAGEEMINAINNSLADGSIGKLVSENNLKVEFSNPAISIAKSMKLI